MVALTAGKTYLERAFEEDLARLEGESGRERIRYAAADHSARWAHPEEKVRAELWAELLYRYEYPAERIGIEVTIPGRTPNLYADLVLYADDDHKEPYFVFECKREEVSDPALTRPLSKPAVIGPVWGPNTAAWWPGAPAVCCALTATDSRRENGTQHLYRHSRPLRQPPEWRFLKDEPSREN